MFGPLLQIVMQVGLTHGVRALGGRVGPRTGGLLMGVPSTTALVRGVTQCHLLATGGWIDVSTGFVSVGALYGMGIVIRRAPRW